MKSTILLKTKLSTGIQALQDHLLWRRQLPPEWEEWDNWSWDHSGDTGCFVSWQQELAMDPSWVP